MNEYGIIIQYSIKIDDEVDVEICLQLWEKLKIIIMFAKDVGECVNLRSNSFYQ